MGRSRGGSGTKIHAAVTPMGHPVATEWTGGQAGDSLGLPGLIEGQDTGAVIADKAYDAGTNREAVYAAEAAAIPPRKSREEKVPCDRHLYKERFVVECLFGRIKRRRRVATRYDKKAANHLGFVWLAAIRIMLA